MTWFPFLSIKFQFVAHDIVRFFKIMTANGFCKLNLTAQ
jgi:hypothetical protein